MHNNPCSRISLCSKWESPCVPKAVRTKASVQHNMSLCSIRFVLTVGGLLFLYIALLKNFESNNQTSYVRDCVSPTMACVHFENYSGVVKTGKNIFVWDPCANRRCAPGSMGNVLSRYWNTRAMLHFAAVQFKVGPATAIIMEQTSFLRYLPFQSTAPSCPDALAYMSGCVGCSKMGQFSWLYDFPAMCNGAWTDYRHTIQKETMAALLQWHNATQQYAPVYGKNHAVVQYRCARDTFNAEGYGPMGYSCYDVIPHTTVNITIVASMDHPPCARLVHDLRLYFNQTWKNANVSIVSSSIEHDFSMLAHAPLMIKHGQSTFGLWAGLTGSGTVYSIPLPAVSAINQTPNLGHAWKWRDCPILPPQANIENVDRIIQWVRSK